MMIGRNDNNSVNMFGLIVLLYSIYIKNTENRCSPELLFDWYMFIVQESSERQMKGLSWMTLALKMNHIKRTLSTQSSEDCPAVHHVPKQLGCASHQNQLVTFSYVHFCVLSDHSDIQKWSNQRKWGWAQAYWSSTNLTLHNGSV